VIYPAMMATCLRSYLGLRAQRMALQWAMLVPTMVGAALVTALEWRFPHSLA
jgi:hypothetical protein